jgi:hypothetical protein
MSAETNRPKLEAFMAALVKQVTGPGRIYLAGGATAVLLGWQAFPACSVSALGSSC